MKRKFLSVLIALVLVLSFSLVMAAPAAAADPIDLAVNDENPWTSKAFTLTDVLPGEALVPFPVKFENVGNAEGILTFSLDYVENDIDGTPAPDMDADQFASLVYVAAVTQQYRWPADPEKPPDGYIGAVKDDLPNWLGMDLNGDGYVSLYELKGCSPILWATDKGDTLPTTASSEFIITFQLGDSLVPFEAGGAIQMGVEDSSSQGDGINVEISATLKQVADSLSDTERSSGNVFQAAGVAGPVENVDTGVTYGTIQLAIDDASPNDTISVAAGTYTEPQLSINNSLTILGVGKNDVTIKRSSGSSYFLHVFGAINFTMKDLTIDASGSATTNFVAHISGLTSATFENVTVIGQGKDYTTDEEPYSYVDPTNNNIVGGLDLINVTSASLTNVTVRDVSRNGFSFTNVNKITLKDFTASNCGHSDSTGWAGLALYRTVEGESKLIMSRYGINSISNAPIGVNAHIISGTVNLRPTSFPGSLSISDVLVPVVAPNTSKSDTFAQEVIPSAPYKVYATDGSSQGFASYFFADGDAIAAALDAFILFDFEHVVYDLATPEFIVGAGMKIQSAVVAASDGDTISVRAGTYDEEITINKSLTLLGAQADVPIVNGVRAGGESVISGTLTSWPYNRYCVVRIGHSDVVVNGFTIEGAKQWNIGIQGYPEGISNILISYNYIKESGYDGIFRANSVADVTINHNYIASNNRGILTNGGATTITDNTFYHNGQGIAFMGIDPYSLYFPDYDQPNYPTIISGNTFTDDSTSIYLRLDKGHQSITITGNDITGARNDAIRTGNTYDVDIVNPAIHFNNIWNNEFGINNQVAGINLDATLNWWGNISGPNHTDTNPGGIGDNVSDNVSYMPWLTREFKTVVDDNIAYFGISMVYLYAGWNTFSTPIALDGVVEWVDSKDADRTGVNTWGDYKALGDGLNLMEGVANAYWYDANDTNGNGAYWEPVASDHVLNPCDAIYVRMAESDIAPILFSPNVSVPTKQLYADWNLVGLAWMPESMEAIYGLPANEALVSVKQVTGDYTGYVQVASPSVNQPPWTYTGEDIDDWAVSTQDPPEDWMLVTNGYWVFMLNEGTLAGFASAFTPVSLD